MRRSSWGGIVILALACSGPPTGSSGQSTPAPTIEPGPTPPPPPPTKTDAPPPAKDDPVIVDEPTVAAPRPANETPTTTGFWLAAARDGELDVAELGDELVLAGGTILAHVRPDGALARMPDVQRGLLDPGAMDLSEWEVMSLGGRWPDPVWMYTQSMGSRSTPVPYMYYRKGDRWQRKLNKSGPLLWSYDSFTAWTGGRVLALRTMTATEVDEEASPGKHRQLAAALAANPPRIDVLAPGAAPQPFQLTAGSRPHSVAALASGEVFVLTSGEGDARFTLERFAPGASTATREPLDRVGARATALTAGRLYARGDALYLVGAAVDQRGLVLRRDDRRWLPIPSLPGSLRSLAIGPEATLWAVVDDPETDLEHDDPVGALYQQTGAGAWRRVPLPQIRRPDRDRPRWILEMDAWKELPVDLAAADELSTVDPDQVVARADGDVWITGGIKGWMSVDGTKIRHVALRSRPVREVLELPSAPALRSELLALQPAKPWDAKCLELDGWLPIATLAASDPPEVASKLAQDLGAAIPDQFHNVLTAVREVEIHGRRVVGLLASPSEPAEVAAILEAAARVHPDKRRFECTNPRPLRELLRFAD